MEYLSFSSKYSGPISLSLTILTLLYNIFEIVRIRYGKVLITKTTLRPYIHSLLYLGSYVLEGFIRVWMNEIDLDKGRDFDPTVLKESAGFEWKSILHVINCFTLTLFTYFIGGRILSCLIKLEFMIF